MTEQPLPPRWYRPDQVAALVGLSRATIYRRIEDGTIPAVRIGGLYRIPAAALQHLLRLAQE